MRSVEIRGEPGAMGREFGRILKSEVARLYSLRLDNALRQAKALGNPQASEAALLDVATACCEETQRFDPDGFAELEGIADGTGLSVEQVMAMNGLTDLRDILAWCSSEEAEGCTSVIVPTASSLSGRAFCGQTWDLASDNAPHVLTVVREPAGAPRTWSVTTDGCLSLMGLSEQGLAIGTTNLRTHDARPGVPYLSLIHRALGAENALEAAALIEGAHRAGAHYFYIVDSSGKALALECTATRHRRHTLSDRAFVQCNHCRVPAHHSFEADTPQRSSRARQRRMQTLVDAAGTGLDGPRLRGFFEDRNGGDLAIRRDDFAGISTNAAVVVEPAARCLWACPGLPHAEGWQRFGPPA
jgi:isopenicillin-N N-acyltransferase-like protein